MSDLVKRAEHFAVQAHKRIDHRRKYSHQPYDVHLRAVAELVAEVTDDDEAVAAAWLHDTVEDTPATFRDIEREFGLGVAQMVTDLTDVSRPSDGNRAARKALDRAHLAKAAPRSKTVKLADLIDNCRDICRHDPGFARVFASEMAALLDVLQEGDAGLLEQAREVLADCSRKLGLSPENASFLLEDESDFSSSPQSRTLRLFSDAFSAKDIAEPLKSFDVEARSGNVRSALQTTGNRLAGVRRDGGIVGYVREEWLGDGVCGDHMRPFRSAQVLSVDASLSDVIHVLTRFDTCFLTLFGGVEGCVRRPDIQKPVARMWLFGMITMIEMELAGLVRQTWPDGSWCSHLSDGRLSKAERLLDERRRRGQHCDLVDCLQLSDKALVVLKDADRLKEYGFVSRKAAKQVVKELESLRNNLAHGQDIVSHDWAQIARMTRRFES